MRRCVGVCSAAAVAVAAVAVVDALRGCRLMRWLRGAQQEHGAARRRASGASSATASSARSASREQRRCARADAARRSSCRPSRRRRTACCCSTRTTRSSGATRVAADHFGLDPQRDRRQRITNLVRAPAFVAYLQARRLRRAGDVPRARAAAARCRCWCGRYGEGLKLVLSQDMTERERAEPCGATSSPTCRTRSARR